MKITVIPDLHGRHEMLNNINLKNDYIIFLGDIFDSFDKSSQDQIKAFRDIQKLQISLGSRFIWLLGNHDLHYLELDNRYIRGSGFSNFNCLTYNQLLLEMKDYYYNFFVIENNIFSHAGIMQLMLDEMGIDVEKLCEYKKYQKQPKQFYYIGYERGGEMPYSGMYWAGINEFNSSPISRYNQIVGHTAVKKPFIKKMPTGESHLFTDCEKVIEINLYQSLTF